MRRALLLVALLVSACATATTSTWHHRHQTSGGASERPSPRPGERYSLLKVEPLTPSANLALAPASESPPASRSPEDQPATPSPSPEPSPIPPPSPSAEPAAPRMRVHLIDVGQGLAVLLEFSCAAVLVDVGGEGNEKFDSAQALSSYLLKFFLRRPDLKRTFALVVLTHPHRDHTANIELVAGQYTIQNVVTDGLTEGSGAKGQVWLHEWAESHKVPLFKVDANAVPTGGLTNPVIDPVQCADEDPQLSVLWGAPSDAPAGWSWRAFNNGNNQSVALRVGFGKATVLLTGDLEGEALHSMITKHAGTNVIHNDVWQVSHHGSEHGATQEFIDAAAPEIALMGTGSPTREVEWSAWAYGHPRLKVIEMLDKKITRERPTVEVQVAAEPRTFQPYRLSHAIYATGWDGSVLVDVESDGRFRVRTTR